LKILGTTYIIITLLLFSLSNAGEAEDLFKKANTLYQEGEFEAAIAKYETIYANGLQSGELFYNLGNAYYKIGNLGRARLYYEKAKNLIADQETIEENLEILTLRLVDQIEKPPQLFLNIWWEAVVNILSTHQLSYIVLGLFWMVLILASLYMRNRKRGNDRMKMPFFTAAFILVFVSTIWFNKLYLIETGKYGIILSGSVTVHTEPSDKTTEAFVIHEGTKVKIERTSGNWYEIRLVDGKTGWLSNDILEII